MCEPTDSDYRVVIVILRLASPTIDAVSRKRAARLIQRHRERAPYDRLVVLISIDQDTTEPTPVKVGLSMGATTDVSLLAAESKSVELLVRDLERKGIATRGLTVQESGVTVHAGGPLTGVDISVDPGTIRWALPDHFVVLLPGSFATNVQREIVRLGAPDRAFIAILVGRELDARRCDVINDIWDEKTTFKQLAWQSGGINADRYRSRQ
jgi:hypothetical protein